MNAAGIGRQIGEEVANPPLMGFFPGGFKPPTKGHYEAARDLASRSYITKLVILIGGKERDGITSQQSKAIWDIYLKANPNPKIEVQISPEKSPIKYLFKWFGDDLNREAYVAGAQDEVDDQKYFESLKQAYGNRVHPVTIIDKFADEDGERLSGTEVRGTFLHLKETYAALQQNPQDKKLLNDYNTTYDYFKSLFPEAVINKGKFDDILKVLGVNFPKPESLQEDIIPGGLAKGKSIKDLAKKHNVSLDQIKSALKKGVKTEMEHTTSKKAALEIAMDHVFEDPKYYDKLAGIEEEKIKGADGKACWDGYRYGGTKNGKDICIRVKEDRNYNKEKNWVWLENEDKLQSILNPFVSYACQELKLDETPTIEIKSLDGNEQPSFGAYVPTDHHIMLNPSGRHTVDILRTLAHELVHAKQNQLGILNPDSGTTGHEHENDANAIAGIIIRDYGKQNPQIYQEGILQEAVTRDELDQADAFADKQLAPVDVDLSSTHVLDRLTGRDSDVTFAQLIGFFKRLGQNKKEFFDFFGKYKEIVATDKRTNLNIPFLNMTKKAIAKTVMRKPNFMSTSPKLTFEVEEKKTNPPITRIYFDLDGVLAGFDDQFKTYNDEGLDFKSYIGKYGANKAWDIINKGQVKFWSTMPWNPGGQELYNAVMKIANEKNIEVFILSSPGLDPNGDAKKGKNEWVDKHTSIPLNQRVYKQAKEKHTEAKPGYMLIDDLGSNVAQFIQSGGTGIKNNPEDSTEAIKKLYKFKYE